MGSGVDAYTDDVQIQESLEWGVETESLGKYDDRPYVAVHFRDTSREDRRQMMDFCRSVRDARGRRYGYLTIASIFLTLLTDTGILQALLGVLTLLAFLLGPLTGGVVLLTLTAASLLVGAKGIRFSSNNTAICSGFAAETLVRRGEIFEKPLSHIMPADLARHYRV